jgi:hypothetical protein
MNDLWLNLEHEDAHLFGKEEFLYLMFTVQGGLSKRYGLIEPEFAFYRKEEVQRHPDPMKSSSQTVNVPRLTVCYIRTEDGTSTGIAYCSKPDNPNKWYGRALAFKRAVQILLGRDIYDEIYIRQGTDLDLFLKSLGINMMRKSVYAFNKNYVLVPKTAESE